MLENAHKEELQAMHLYHHPLGVLDEGTRGIHSASA